MKKLEHEQASVYPNGYSVAGAETSVKYFNTEAKSGMSQWNR